ncbi:unnamed protein product [Callosobruchus maculatus]|uniref:Uncharacterized protein n=1 Tax=Callosobruchus maculatus TaxID=64391 RepID=A0A653D9S1_CALMS|nr:unnamed protein product [Callosobruchus maculatus]
MHNWQRRVCLCQYS